MYLGNVRVAQGRYAEADAFYEPVLRMAREIGVRLLEATALHNLAAHLSRYGDVDAARTNLRAALDIGREIGARRLEGYSMEEMGMAAEIAGDLGDAERWYARALAVRREIGYHWGVASTLGFLGAVHGAMGRRAEARAELEEALALARGQDTPGSAVFAACHLAALGDLDPAVAAEEMERGGSRVPHFERLPDYFVLWKATRDPRHLEAAHALLAYAVEHSPEDRRDGMTRTVPTNRAILAAWAARRS